MLKLYSNNKLIFLQVVVLLLLCFTALCFTAVYLTSDKPNNVSFSKLNTEATVQIGDTFTVVLDDGQYPKVRDYKWDLVKLPNNSHYASWKTIPYTASGNYHPGKCQFVFNAIYPGEETISFVFSESYYHNATNTFNITVITV